MTTAEPSSSQTGSSVWDRARSLIYDKSIVTFTSKWYRLVLDRIPENSHVLDVGIGTGAALIANANILRAKNITVVGVDYDESYVKRCKANVQEAELKKFVTVVQADIRHFEPPEQRLYNHIYFSGSFMIIPDQVNVLKKMIELLVDRQDGRIFFTQTFELQKNTWLEWIKPKLLSVTTIDFGHVTYQEDFEDALSAADLAVESDELIDDGKARANVRESRLVCARSKMYDKPESETVA